MDSRCAPRAVACLLLLGALLLGLAQVALLPPFEGFDESGHYSYIQQVADTGRWPVRGDRVSKDVDDYLKVAPTTENMHGPWTYHRFFASGTAAVEQGRRAVHEPAERRYTPGAIGNWQAQHPPLYYFAMAPAYRISSSWSLAAQLFFLRSLSYLIAWGGLCIAVVAMLKNPDERLATLAPFGIALWPALFPMWFPEMARLGNDSLITVFAACTLLLVHRVTAHSTLRDHLLLGATMGLALLTKATYLPVAAAVFALLGLLAWSSRKTPDQFRCRIKGAALCAFAVVAICGWWYVAKYVETGSLIGSNDDINVRAAGGIIAALKQNLDFYSAVRAPWALAESFLWASTWSFVLPPRVTVLPIAVMGLAVAYGAWRHFRKEPMRPVDGLALLTLGFFMAALAQHSLVLLALIRTPAPAWYLHSLAPILAPLVGYGIIAVMSRPWTRGVMAALLLYPLAFLPGALLLNGLYYAGCAPKLPGRLYFARESGLACLADFPRMYDNLSAIALPGVGIGLFIAGWVLMTAGVIAWVRLVSAAAHARQRTAA